MPKARTTPLPFQTLRKRYRGIWWRKALFYLSVFALFILLLFFINFILSFSSLTAASSGNKIGSIFGDIVTGIFGGIVVSAAVWWRKISYNQMHYGKALQDHINAAQTRYQVTYEEAGDLLAFDNPSLITIDNFFRYIGTANEANMLPRLQRFGTTIVPGASSYRRLTLYWETGKGFYLSEEKTKSIADFH